MRELLTSPIVKENEPVTNGYSASSVKEQTTHSGMLTQPQLTTNFATTLGTRNDGRCKRSSAAKRV